MRTYIEKLVTGTVSLLLIALAVVVPPALAGFMEPMETAGEGIRSFEEIISEESTETNYIPYIEYNSTTSAVVDQGGTLGGLSLYNKTDGGRDFPTPSYNYEGYWDMVVSPWTLGADDCVLYFSVLADGNDMLENSINQFVFSFNVSTEYNIGNIRAYTTQDDGTLGANYYNLPIDTAYYSGNHNYGFELSTTDLQEISNIHSLQHTGDEILRFQITFRTGGITEGGEISFNFQLNPEYYEETTTVYDNETVTTWEPYILTISNPYRMTKVLLGLFGVIITVTALFSTPQLNWGDYINFNSRRKRRK